MADHEDEEDFVELKEDEVVACAHCGHPTSSYGKSPDFPLCDACEG